MRAAVLGGGPGGLNFAISLKLRDASHDVVVIERNKPDDTFGWGVVLSDETLGNLHSNDPDFFESNPRLFRLLGRHRGALSRHGDAFRRTRLQRHRPQAAAQYSAGTRTLARREDQV